MGRTRGNDRSRTHASPSPWTPAALGADVQDYYDITTGITVDGGNGAISFAPAIGADTMSQGVLANRLVYTPNVFGPLPGLKGNGGAGTQAISAAFEVALAQPVTIYVVYKGLDGSNRIIFDSPVGTRNVLLTGNENTGFMYAGVVLNVTGQTAAAHILCCTFSGASSSYYVDGALVTSGNAGPDGMGGFGLGNCKDNIAPSGYFGDALVCKSAHDAAKRALVFGYLRGRFGTP